MIFVRLVAKLWQEPVFRTQGFMAKVLGFAKTDGLILYVSDEEIDIALGIVAKDALEHGYGFGMPARFAQRIHDYVPGITLTSDPEDAEGDAIWTFGGVVSNLLQASLAEAIPDQKLDGAIAWLLGGRPNISQWVPEVFEPIFARHAEALFGSRLNMENLAFIDRGRWQP